MLLLSMMINCALWSGQPGRVIKVTSDLDCMLLVDDTFAANAKAGEERTLSLASGKHTLSALTPDGDLWEEELTATDESPRTIYVQLKSAKAKQAQASALRTQLKQKEQQLTDLAEKKKPSAADTEKEARLQRSLVFQAIEFYARRYVQELGLKTENDSTGDNLTQTGLSTPISSNNPGNSIGAITDYLVAWRFKTLARRHQIAANAAIRRIAELEKVMKDPLRDPRQPGEHDYTEVVRDVFDGETRTTFMTRPSTIFNEWSLGDKILSCASIFKVSGGKRLTLDVREFNPYRKRTAKLVLAEKATNGTEILLGDLYLICPSLE